MKKKKIGILLVLISLFTLAGCGSRILKSDNDLKKILKERYPGENFTILYKEEIDIPGSTGGCNSPGKGSYYKVKSLDTDIEFAIFDIYYFNYFNCNYDVRDEYFDEAKEKFLNDNSSSKMVSYTVSGTKSIGLAFYLKNYSSKEEMINDLWDKIEKLNNTYPLKSYKKHIFFSIGIENSRDNTLLSLSEIKNKKQIIEIVNAMEY